MDIGLMLTYSRTCRIARWGDDSSATIKSPHFGGTTDAICLQEKVFVAWFDTFSFVRSKRVQIEGFNWLVDVQHMHVGSQRWWSESRSSCRSVNGGWPVDATHVVYLWWASSNPNPCLGLVIVGQVTFHLHMTDSKSSLSFWSMKNKRIKMNDGKLILSSDWINNLMKSILLDKVCVCVCIWAQ